MKILDWLFNKKQYNLVTAYYKQFKSYDPVLLSLIKEKYELDVKSTSKWEYKKWLYTQKSKTQIIRESLVKVKSLKGTYPLIWKSTINKNIVDLSILEITQISKQDFKLLERNYIKDTLLTQNKIFTTPVYIKAHHKQQSIHLGESGAKFIHKNPLNPRTEPSTNYNLNQFDGLEILESNLKPKTKASTNYNLNSATSDWDTIKGIPLYFFYYYYPTRYQDVSFTSEEARILIWRFKDGKDYYRKQVEDLFIKKLSKLYSKEELGMLTLLCIPASSNNSNNKRYKEFSENVCRELGMRNSFNLITITKEKEPSHLGGSDSATYRIISNFKNANVILFDDVATKGDSINYWAETMKSHEANVVGAITIGRTYSSYNDMKPHPQTGEL